MTGDAGFLPPLQRRRILLGLGATLAGGGCVQAQGNNAMPPCPARPGDIVSLALEGRGNRAGYVTVLGHALRPGDLPAGRGIVARLGNGQAAAAQIDIRNRHPDGSVRLAQIAVALPALNAGQRTTIMLVAGAEERPAPLPWAGRSATLEFILPNGALWQLDLLSQAMRGPLWQSGPLAVQGRAEAMVPPEAAGGVSSLRIVADLSLHADGALLADLWFRNDIAMRGGGGTARYRARLLLDGQEMARFDIPRQAQYTGFGRLLAAGTAGNAPLLRHDAGYLADVGAVARYDINTGVDESVLARMAAGMASPSWNAPFSPRGVTQDMTQTGGRGDIGPATAPQAVWLMTGDRRAAAYSIGQAEAAGGIPWHFWDPSGGRGDGGWLDARRWPRLWTDARGGPPPGSLTQPIPGDTGWTADCAHQPDLNFVPHLLTGRRACLDELQAQAAWCVVSQWPDQRGHPGLSAPGEGLNVVRGNQVRGAAWSIRQLDNAAWASPAEDPNLPYLRACAEGNWGWLRSRLTAWSAEQGELSGCIPGVYGVKDTLPPWQQDYFASSAASAARRGNPDAMAVLNWMSNFLAGRFLSVSKGFDPHDGAAYLIAARETRGEAIPLRSWAETAQAMRARDLSNAGGWRKTEGDYAQLALQSLAALIDVLGTREARAAHVWLASSGAPFIRQQDFRRDPIFNIVPRAASRCTA